VKRRLSGLDELRDDARKRVGPGVCWICEENPVEGKRDVCEECRPTYLIIYYAEYATRRIRAANEQLSKRRAPPARTPIGHARPRPEPGRPPPRRRRSS
jgi:hypothetical protein